LSFGTRKERSEERERGIWRMLPVPRAQKAIACQEALQAAASWGMEQVQVESDAKNLVKAMQDSSLNRTPEGIIYRDIRCFSRFNFSSISFLFCPRTCNNMAHDLAAVGVRKQVVRSL
jgi:ribonuclease HI